MKNKIARIIIAGGRDFSDYNLLKEKVDYYLQNAINNNFKIIIVSGTAKGADKLGEKYAKEKGYEIAYFPADWSKGKRAGYLRNEQMAEYAKQKQGALIAFWDESSKGTKHMIDLAKKHLETCSDSQKEFYECVILVMQGVQKLYINRRKL